MRTVETFKGRRPGGKVLPSCAGFLLFDADVLGHLDRPDHP